MQVEARMSASSFAKKGEGPQVPDRVTKEKNKASGNEKATIAVVNIAHRES